MIVGIKEQRGARMDEGINSFVDVCGAKAFEAGEYAPKHGSEYTRGNGCASRSSALWETCIQSYVTRADGTRKAN